MATTSASRDKSTSTKPMLKARFSEIVAINFQVDDRILKPLIPKGLELDYYNGETYVSLIAMMLRGVKVWGLPFSIVPSCPELSLRFYVRNPKASDNNKGTCLIRDYIGGGTAAWFLESQFGSEFSKIKMKQNNSGFRDPKAIPEAEYQWKVDEHWNKLRVKAKTRITKTGPDTKMGFILGHNNYYGTVGGKTVGYKVVRPTWQAWSAAQANFTCDVQRLFGKQFVKALAKRPASVFVTGGSPVTIYKPERI